LSSRILTKYQSSTTSGYTGTTTTGTGIGGTTGTHGSNTYGSNTTTTHGTHDAHNKDGKKDSNVGKLMEKAGNVLHQESIAEKGRLKREEAGARPEGTY
jgi:hypothetical protein